MVELTACGPDDQDAQRAASVLAAYFNVEHTRAFRRRLGRRLAVAAIVASLLNAMTPLLPGIGLFVAVTALAVAATAGAVAEWHAENALRRTIHFETEPLADWQYRRTDVVGTYSTIRDHTTGARDHTFEP